MQVTADFSKAKTKVKVMCRKEQDLPESDLKPTPFGFQARRSTN